VGKFSLWPISRARLLFLADAHASEIPVRDGNNSSMTLSVRMRERGSCSKPTEIPRSEILLAEPEIHPVASSSFSFLLFYKPTLPRYIKIK
jgi:hypothetical protein